MDEFVQQVEQDELADQAEYGKLKPRQYAKLRGLAPQLVYYAIRAGHIKAKVCVCGAKVIDVAQADAWRQEVDTKKHPERPTTSSD